MSASLALIKRTWYTIIVNEADGTVKQLASLEGISMKENNRLCISVAELEELLSISRTTAFALVKAEGFPSFTLGRRILIPVASLERWLDAQAANQKTVDPTRR